MTEKGSDIFGIEEESSTSERRKKRKPRVQMKMIAALSPGLVYIPVFIFLLRIPDASASIECESDEECARILNLNGTECVEGLCTNPFAQGCLRRYLGEDKFPHKRICNLNDHGDTSHCESSPLDFLEMRVASSNWDAGIFNGWLFQIFLNELVQVPASIESGFDFDNNFYDIFNEEISYDVPTYDWPALRNALENNNCQEVREEGKPCAHVM